MDEFKEKVEKEEDVASEAPSPQATEGEHRQRDMEARCRALIQRGKASEGKSTPVFEEQASEL